MKVATSYFYQIRFFKPYMIPLSTAMSDPKWFHSFNGPQFTFVDKNGVVNGLRVPAMSPGPSCSGLCSGTPCPQSPLTCDFLSAYLAQLERLDCDDYMHRVNNLCNRMKQSLRFNEEPVAVFIVHEAPTKLCSERGAIQEWLTSHGYPCRELDYTDKFNPAWRLPE